LKKLTIRSWGQDKKIIELVKITSQSWSWVNPAWGSWWSITLHFWSFPFGISILFQGTFWPNSILFQGIENRFWNSILFQYFQYRVGTLYNVQSDKKSIKKLYSYVS